MAWDTLDVDTPLRFWCRRVICGENSNAVPFSIASAATLRDVPRPDDKASYKGTAVGMAYTIKARGIDGKCDVQEHFSPEEPNPVCLSQPYRLRS